MNSTPYEYATNLLSTKGLTTTGFKLRGVRPISYKPNKSRPFEFIKTSEITSDRNSELFDRITLSPLQDHLIEALHIIDPRIKNINFISDGFANPNKRSPYVVYEGSNMRYKLSSMGDETQVNPSTQRSRSNSSRKMPNYASFSVNGSMS